MDASKLRAFDKALEMSHDSARMARDKTKNIGWNTASGCLVEAWFKFTRFTSMNHGAQGVCFEFQQALVEIPDIVMYLARATSFFLPFSGSPEDEDRYGIMAPIHWARQIVQRGELDREHHGWLLKKAFDVLKTINVAIDGSVKTINPASEDFITKRAPRIIAELAVAYEKIIKSGIEEPKDEALGFEFKQLEKLHADACERICKMKMKSFIAAVIGYSERGGVWPEGWEKDGEKLLKNEVES